MADDIGFHFALLLLVASVAVLTCLCAGVVAWFVLPSSRVPFDDVIVTVTSVSSPARTPTSTPPPTFWLTPDERSSSETASGQTEVLSRRERFRGTLRPTTPSDACVC